MRNSVRTVVYLCALLLALVLASSQTQAQHPDDIYWEAVADGPDSIYAMIEYDGDLIVAGKFLSAGGMTVNNIASWDGSTWQAIGTGFNNQVKALMIYEGELIAGGWFTSAGAVGCNHVAKWVDTLAAWQPLGAGVSGYVYALEVYDGELIVGGDNGVTAWNGSSFHSLGTDGPSTQVYALEVYEGLLVAGGLLPAGLDLEPLHNVASWDGTVWHALDYDSPYGSYGTNNTVLALKEVHGQLWVGGFFTEVGDFPCVGIARYNQQHWYGLGPGLDFGTVSAIGEYNGDFIIGGYFYIFETDTAYSIARWNDYDLEWQTLGSGVEPFTEVTALYTYGDELVVGGDFTEAGLKTCSGMATWNKPADPARHCPAENAEDGEYISRVQLADIDLSTYGYGYTDWYAWLINNGVSYVTIGQSYPITITGSGTTSGDACAVWVDWNQDLDFDDPGESFTLSGSPGAGPYTGNIYVPLDCPGGSCRMRVRLSGEGVPLDPCLSSSYPGEVEDYRLIVNTEPCSASGGCGGAGGSNSHWIEAVEVSGGSFSNLSYCEQFGDFYDGDSIPLPIGSPVSLDITTCVEGDDPDNGAQAWVDWNNDLDFDDVNETIGMSGSGRNFSTVLQAPAGLTPGEYRLRLRTWYGTPADISCGVTLTGEVEDYRIFAFSTTCCIPPTVGDIDQSGVVDITDVSVLIDNQFLTLTPLVCEDEGDCDLSGAVDITDVSVLIDNQFLTLTPLPACP